LFFHPDWLYDFICSRSKRGSV